MSITRRHLKSNQRETSLFAPQPKLEKRMNFNEQAINLFGEDFTDDDEPNADSNHYHNNNNNQPPHHDSTSSSPTSSSSSPSSSSSSSSASGSSSASEGGQRKESSGGDVRSRSDNRGNTSSDEEEEEIGNGDLRRSVYEVAEVIDVDDGDGDGDGDLFGSDNEDYCKTLATSPYPIPGIQTLLPLSFNFICEPLYNLPYLVV